MKVNSKILFLVTEDWYFVSHRLPLAIKAKEAGYDVVVATKINTHRKMIEDAGLRVIPLNKMNRSSLNPYLEMQALFELICIYRIEKPDLVHQVALKPVIYGTLAATFTRVSSKVNALGGLGFVFSSERKLARFLKLVSKYFLGVVLSGSDKRLILQNESDYNVILENKIINKNYVRIIRGAGVELNKYRFTPLPEGKPIVMMASRLLIDKGVQEFVMAAKFLKHKGRDFRCVLVGAPDLANPTAITEEQLSEWVEKSYVEWWGYQCYMPTIIASSHLMVLPSFYGEGLPKVLIEAAACGRAVITTDHPGCRDAIHNNVTGLLVPCRDFISLAAAIEQFLDHPELFKEMGEAGRGWAENNFDVNDVIGEHLSIYKELMVSATA